MTVLLEYLHLLLLIFSCEPPGAPNKVRLREKCSSSCPLLPHWQHPWAHQTMHSFEDIGMEAAAVI